MLAAKKQGAIVNIASVLGLAVAKGAVAYAAAKAGVVQVTKALAVELAFKGVRVNAIAPGWFVTEINDEYLDKRGRRRDQARDSHGPLRQGWGSRRRAAALGVRRRQLHHRRHASWSTAARWCRSRGSFSYPPFPDAYGLYAVARNRGHPPARARLRRGERAAAGGRPRELLRPREHSARAAGAGARQGEEGRPVGAAGAQGIRRHGAADRRLGGGLRGSGALDLRAARHPLHGARRRQHEPVGQDRHAGAEGKMAAPDRRGQGALGLRHDRAASRLRLRSRR